MSYNITALGGLNLETQSSPQAWNVKNIALAPARAAFLALVRLNVWGLAKLFSIKLFFVSDAVTATQSPPNMWWDLGAKMRNGWYNLGGKWGSFVNAVNAGKNKKARLFWLAPKALKEKFKAQGITGYKKQGIGDPTTVTAITLATGIITSLTPLIILIVNQSNLKKDLAYRESETEAARAEAELNRQFELERLKLLQSEQGKDGGDGEGFTFTDDEGNITKAGYGAIGVGILGLLFVGTELNKKKNKK